MGKVETPAYHDTVGAPGSAGVKSTNVRAVALGGKRAARQGTTGLQDARALT